MNPGLDHPGVEMDDEQPEQGPTVDPTPSVSAKCKVVRDCGQPADQTPWGIEFVYDNPAITTTSGGTGIKVAVIDHGVTWQHIDLVSRVEGCINFLVNPPLDGSCEDTGNHGTPAASMIAADGASDGLGLYGVAPGVEIYALKVCDVTLDLSSTYCSITAVAKAMNWSRDNGIHIISISLGWTNSDPSLESGTNYFLAGGGLIVAAAGNSGPTADTIKYPAAYAGVVAVGNMDINRGIVNASSRGDSSVCCDSVIQDREVEFAAPGRNLIGIRNDGTYGTFSGTSFATPYLAGLAAKLWQGDGPSTRSHLRTKVLDITECYTHTSHCAVGFDIASGFGAPRV